MQKGFTLVEIMVGVAISSFLVLAAFLILQLSIQQSVTAKAESDLNDEIARLSKYLDIYVGNSMAILCPVPQSRGGGTATNCTDVNQDYYRLNALGYCQGDVAKILEIITEETFDMTAAGCRSIGEPNVLTNGCKRRVGIYWTAPIVNAPLKINNPGKIWMKDEKTGVVFYDSVVDNGSKFGLTKIGLSWSQGENATNSNGKGALQFRIEGKAKNTISNNVMDQSFCPYINAVGSGVNPDYTNGVIRSVNLSVTLRNMYLRGIHFGKMTEGNLQNDAPNGDCDPRGGQLCTLF